mgnify:CR=1 FL=1
MRPASTFSIIQLSNSRVFGMGPIAVWIGMFTDWTVRAIVFTVRLRSRKWLEHRVI